MPLHSPDARLIMQKAPSFVPVKGSMLGAIRDAMNLTIFTTVDAVRRIGRRRCRHQSERAKCEKNSFH